MMRKLFSLIICVCMSFFISSCNGGNGYTPELLKAESLINEYPDSAILILHALDKNKVNKSKAVRMNYYLLLYQAEDLSDINHISDSVMLKVVNYYEKNNYGDRLMRAYYLLGSAYDNMGDSPEALKYYHKALDLPPKSTSFSISGHVYSKIGYIFGSQNLYDEAISAHKKACRHRI